MITQPLKKPQRRCWQTALSLAITDPVHLLERLHLSPQAIAYCSKQAFGLRVPLEFVAKMQLHNPNDPLLLQVLPHQLENQATPGFNLDPLQERQQNPMPGLLHKFASRVLLVVSQACAVHCRYCFRRYFPYEDNNPSLKDWEHSLKYIAADPNIKEVIFSGGDPLSAPDRYLTKLVERIAEIEHVKIIRIHTRLPVMIPQRICPELLSWCTKTRLKIIMVLHINHPQELCTALKTQVAQLCAQQILVLNQSVLLKNINDCSQILSELSWKLFDANILPYYLHLLDPVQGSAHFGVATKEVQPLLQQLMTDLPGYLVPKVVREIPGAPYKVPACLSCTQALELPTLT